MSDVIVSATADFYITRLAAEIMYERPPHKGAITLFSPSVRGRAAEGGRGSLTRHLEFELGNTPLQLWLHSAAFMFCLDVSHRLDNDSQQRF
jgi:hypothetical protein